VRPEHAVVKVGEQAAFTCAGLDQYGQPFAAAARTVCRPPGGLEVLAEVRVTTEEEHRRRQDEDDRRPGKQVLRWQGTVPPQKWMNFYTKVLSRFASSPGLKLEVSFEAPVDRDQAQARAGDARSGLKELGLDDGVSLA
jgi:hypothetical protein